MNYRGKDPFYGNTNWRAVKKAERTFFGDPVYMAHLEGECAATARGVRRNPYPPGKRHNAWADSYNNSDPMGDWHGRNE